MQDAKAKGEAGEAELLELIKNEGETVTGEQITFETSTGSRTRVDRTTTNPEGSKMVRESKEGPSAKLSTGQSDMKADIEAGRPVIPRGEKAKEAGFTEPTVFDEFKEDQS